MRATGSPREPAPASPRASQRLRIGRLALAGDQVEPAEAERHFGEQPRVELGRASPPRRNRSRTPRQAAPMVSPLRSLLHRGELRCLILGDQRVDHLVERLAGDHLVELVEGEVDAVVGDPPLREIVGADALRAVAGADLPLARLRTRVSRASRCAS